MVPFQTLRKFRDYGGMDRLLMDEKVVAPSDLAASALLMEVPCKTAE